MRAIIIGAGRGRRLMPNTEKSPKCFAQVQGRRILDWTLDALRSGGVEEVCFIGGYRMDSVQAEYPEFSFRHNADWENNNILASLMCAEDLMDAPFLCSYSDILFTVDVVRGLIASDADITLGLDTDWVEHYKPRSHHPPHDAEKATVSEELVTRVHRDVDPADAYGEFIGVAKFSLQGASQLKQHYHRCREEFAGLPFRDAAVFEKAYLIQLLQDMIEQGTPMAHVDTPGHYREIDTQQDLDLAQQLWNPPA
jgi:choline kinase